MKKRKAKKMNDGGSTGTTDSPVTDILKALFVSKPTRTSDVGVTRKSGGPARRKGTAKGNKT